EADPLRQRPLLPGTDRDRRLGTPAHLVDTGVPLQPPAPPPSGLTAGSASAAAEPRLYLCEFGLDRGSHGRQDEYDNRRDQDEDECVFDHALSTLVKQQAHLPEEAWHSAEDSTATMAPNFPKAGALFTSNSLCQKDVRPN